MIGDGIAQTVIIDDSTFMDVAQNPFDAVSGFPLIELPDTTKYCVYELNLSSGVLVIRAQETIVSTTSSSLVLANMVFLENVTVLALHMSVLVEHMVAMVQVLWI